jgi:hypothetical protein
VVVRRNPKKGEKTEKGRKNLPFQKKNLLCADRYIEKFRRLREGLTRIKKKRKKTKQETGSNFFFLAVAH